MKKMIFALALSGILLFVFQSFVFKANPAAEFPDDVTDILKTHCYDCHSQDASNKKAKIALNFDKWDDYKDSKKVSKLDAICEVVSKDKMPPEKYLKNNPGKALTDDQKVVLCKWTDAESDKLMGGN
jgi:uncharacterized membrane protein